MIKGVDNEFSNTSQSISRNEELSYEQIMKLKYGSQTDKIKVVEACLKEKAPAFIKKYLSNCETPITKSPQLDVNDDLYYHPAAYRIGR